jgi:phage terminase Nu1 subunit (DNA packaging protein)
VKYVEKSVPISSSRGTPVTWTVAAFTSVIAPSGLIVTRGSSEASISERLYAFARCTASSAAFWSVMSRAMVEAPTTPPCRSRIGERVRETRIGVPSFRIRTVSKWWTEPPRRTCSRIRADSSSWPGGARTETFRPTISGAVYP